MPKRHNLQIPQQNPTFHLTMHCYLCTLAGPSPTLKEHEAARWLPKDQLRSVRWLPADLTILSLL
jgi:8-oxo-dGTP diphosphatase